jgi:heme A synthase
MIKTIHSMWAYITLIILIYAIFNAVKGLISKKDFEDKDVRISLFTLIVAHIQLIIGLITYFTSEYFSSLLDNGMGNSMKDAVVRLFVVEHPLMMILAIILITIGFSKHKKKTSDKDKFKTIAVFYGIALLFILSKIPWSYWF